MARLVVCRRGASRSADQLVAALTALGHQATRQPPGDPAGWVSVGWGAPGYSLNGQAGRLDKLEELRTLGSAGVPCPEISQAPSKEEIRAGVWLGRTAHHSRARDLRRPALTRRTSGFSYYTRKLEVIEEYRAHVFLSHRDTARYLVVRAGKKVPAPEETQHPWIRSRLSGWNISYDGVRLSDVLRETARQAVRALGLDFGAVDLGVLSGGSPVVFEVNTAPSLDNPATAAVYARRLAALAARAGNHSQTQERTGRP